jgi:predicted DNA-binding protein
MADRKGKEPKDKNITVRMSNEMYERLAALAEADRRRIGEYVRLHLEDLIATLEQRQRQGRAGE